MVVSGADASMLVTVTIVVTERERLALARHLNKNPNRITEEDVAKVMQSVNAYLADLIVQLQRVEN